jgi:hypothetical protein
MVRGKDLESVRPPFTWWTGEIETMPVSGFIDVITTPGGG